MLRDAAPRGFDPLALRRFERCVRDGHPRSDVFPVGSVSRDSPSEPFDPEGYGWFGATQLGRPDGVGYEEKDGRAVTFRWSKPAGVPTLTTIQLWWKRRLPGGSWSGLDAMTMTPAGDTYRLNWEINNRAKWDEDVARRSPHAAKQPLTDAEIEARRTELQDLARSSLAWRAFTYFMGCFACQAFYLLGCLRDGLTFEKGGDGLVLLTGSLFAVSADLIVHPYVPDGASLHVARIISCHFYGTKAESCGGASNGRVDGIGKLKSDVEVAAQGLISPGVRVSGSINVVPKPRRKPVLQAAESSLGTLEVEGNYSQLEGGVLVIQVAGTEAGQFDVLHVAGDATLAGSVDVRFIDGFVPQPGDSVDFVKVDGTITGKLTGSTLVDAPGDPESSQPAVQAEVKWEVTPEGTCRMTVADVVALDDPARLLLGGCGEGVCGAGVAPMLPLAFLGIAGLQHGMRRGISRRRRMGRASPRPFGLK